MPAMILYTSPDRTVSTLLVVVCAGTCQGHDGPLWAGDCEPPSSYPAISPALGRTDAGARTPLTSTRWMRSPASTPKGRRQMNDHVDQGACATATGRVNKNRESGVQAARVAGGGGDGHAGRDQMVASSTKPRRQSGTGHVNTSGDAVDPSLSFPAPFSVSHTARLLGACAGTSRPRHRTCYHRLPRAGPALSGVFTRARAEHMSTTGGGSIPAPRCCCGSLDCAFLAHNARLLEGLERDVSRAAQLGQALLVRHEAYVADSERERKQMTASIGRLEEDKAALETKNASSIQTNRDLLDQLEHLNDAVASSDAHIQALTETLRHAEEEIERLSLLAARTQLLEKQLMDLEREQSQLQSNYDAKLVDERTAVQRWKTAERAIEDLQDQVDRIEKEGREERERHVQVVARMERRVAVEGELNTPAGRAKAKVAHDKGGTSVVSHFVKDILLDNANLQHGIVELREMLINSNEEVERLRDQLKEHQPVICPPGDVPTPTLQKELGVEGESVMNQELHIHHHYHGPKHTKNPSKPQAQRRPKKKRFSLTPTHFDPPPVLDRSSTAAILNQTAVTVPNSRWSQASTLAPGSYPGSPITESHRGSVYDRVFSDVAYDSSRPTSPPDSIDLQSPMFGPVKSHDSAFDQEYAPRHQRRKSHGLKPALLSTIRSTSTPIAMAVKSNPATALLSAVSPANSLSNDTFTLSPALQPDLQSTIPEENEDAPTSNPALSSPASPEEPDASDDFISPLHTIRPTLRRHASHESLISVSGMDIHTLQSRPSQLFYSGNPRFSTPGGAGSVGPELTPWTATAHGTLSRKALDSSTLNRSLLYSSLAHQRRPSGLPAPTKPAAPGALKKVGGWVFGKWGATPAPVSAEPSRPPSAHSQQTMSSSQSQPDAAGKKKPEKPKVRPSGVNQPGPLWGFFDAVPEVQSRVEVREGEYDAEALGDALAEVQQ